MFINGEWIKARSGKRGTSLIFSGGHEIDINSLALDVS